MRIVVTDTPFDLGAQSDAFARDQQNMGAVVTFTGVVRDSDAGGMTAMEIEHYPGMTEKALAAIEAEARERWALQASLIVHRTGRLEPGEQIVLVITAAPHRGDAFAAAEFLMDYLKSRAPFWKKEGTADGGRWVDARVSDEEALARWRAPDASGGDI